jgi:hypothetical protein
MHLCNRRSVGSIACRTASTGKLGAIAATLVPEFQRAHCMMPKKSVVCDGKCSGDELTCTYELSISARRCRGVLNHIIDRSSRAACLHVRDDRSSLTCKKCVLAPHHPLTAPSRSRSSCIVYSSTSSCTVATLAPRHACATADTCTCMLDLAAAAATTTSLCML